MRQDDGVHEGGAAISQLLTSAVEGRRQGLLV
jgi:hypothetical protein